MANKTKTPESRLGWLRHPIVQPLITASILGAGVWYLSIRDDLATVKTDVRHLAEDRGADRAEYKETLKDTKAELTKILEKSVQSIDAIKSDMGEMRGDLRALTTEIGNLKERTASANKSIESIRQFVQEASKASGQIPVRSWLVAVGPTDAVKRIGIHLIDGQTGIVKSWSPRSITEESPQPLIMASFWAVAMTSDGSAQNLSTAFFVDEAGLAAQPVPLLPQCSFAMGIVPGDVSDRLVSRFLSQDKPAIAQGKGQPSTYEKFLQFLKDNAELLTN